MKKLRLIWIVLMAVIFFSCSDSGPTNPDPGENGGEEPASEKQFVWDAMNYWYYWQGDVPELADDYFENDDEFFSYLNGFNTAEDVFNSLLYQDDDFSFFIDDYEEYQDERDGVYAALGFNYGFVYISDTELMGYVRYVIPNSPADDAGLKRLDLFTEVDGTTITENNYLSLLTSDSEHELTMVHLERTDDGFTIVEDSTATVASEEVVEDPVLKTEIIDTSGVKIGYISYNAFRDNYHSRLNDVFGEFKSENIEELVLDLRYNGGGSVLTSQLLSSLISGYGSSDEYAELSYNDKRSSRSRDLYFLDEVPLQNDEGEFEQDNEGNFINSEPMNNLSLSSLYVLTSRSTASASEAVINSLNPYIDVTVIGLKTVGKDEGSLTLYDASPPYLDDSDANPDHKKAIQPIVSKILNSVGEAYPDGFTPDGYDPNANQGSGGCVDDNNDNCVNEITINNLIERPALGSPDEPLLARAIAIITGQITKQKSSSVEANYPKLHEIEMINGMQDLRPNGNGMYLEPFMMPKED